MVKKNRRFELLKATLRGHIEIYEKEREAAMSEIAKNNIDGMVIENRTILYLIAEIENMSIKKVIKELKMINSNVDK